MISEPVIVVTRYDRLPPLKGGDLMRRVHQEDFCQALTRTPSAKYQENNGPSIKDCVALLRRVSSDPDVDVEVFIEANILNWYIGGVDAHAKNFSILIGPDGNRLAPLYDISSQLQYEQQLGPNNKRLAMKVGDFYEIPRIGLAAWSSVAKACKLDQEQVIGWVHELGASLPQHVSDASNEAIEQGLDTKIIEPLRDALIQHIQERVASVTTVTYSHIPGPH